MSPSQVTSDVVSDVGSTNVLEEAGVRPYLGSPRRGRPRAESPLPVLRDAGESEAPPTFEDLSPGSFHKMASDTKCEAEDLLPLLDNQVEQEQVDQALGLHSTGSSASVRADVCPVPCAVCCALGPMPFALSMPCPLVL